MIIQVLSCIVVDYLATQALHTLQQGEQITQRAIGWSYVILHDLSIYVS